MLLTIVVFVLILGLLVFVHEFGHFIIAKRQGVKVDEFGFGFPPRIFGIKRGETTYSLNLIPIGGFVKILGEQGEEAANPRSFAAKSPGVRARIISMGVIMNFLLAIILLTIGFKVGLPVAISDDEEEGLRDIKIQIMAAGQDTPAEDQDLRVWDEIISIDSKKFSKVDQIQAYTKEKAGLEIILTIKRGNEILEKKIVPRANPPEGQGPLGIGLTKTGIVSYPLHLALWMGCKTTFSMIVVIFVAFLNIIKELVITGKTTAEVSGPVGIAVMTGQIAKMGWIYVLNFTALLSINLGIINILPFPALDGGRLLFLVIEKIRGKKVSPKVENLIHTIGFVLLMLLIILVTFKDITKFGGKIIQVLKRLVGITSI
jgi:regulator of sigma E protease